jgi:hypothetical protein
MWSGISSHLCCAFDVLGVAADEGGVLLGGGHGLDCRRVLSVEYIVVQILVIE